MNIQQEYDLLYKYKWSAGFYIFFSSLATDCLYDEMYNFAYYVHETKNPYIFIFQKFWEMGRLEVVKYTYASKKQSVEMRGWISMCLFYWSWEEAWELNLYFVPIKKSGSKNVSSKVNSALFVYNIKILLAWMFRLFWTRFYYPFILKLTTII